jgi:hypothetical protein
MNEMPTPETDALDHELHSPRVLQDRYSEMRDHARKMERERDEAREALRQIWQSGDAAFLPYIDQETINRWRKAAGWEELK